MLKKILAGAVVVFIVVVPLRALAVQTEYGSFSIWVAFLGHMLALSIAALWFFRGPRDGFWQTFRGIFPRIWGVEFLTFCAVEIVVGEVGLSLDLLAFCFGGAVQRGIVLGLLLAFALPTLWGREPDELASE